MEYSNEDNAKLLVNEENSTIKNGSYTKEQNDPSVVNANKTSLRHQICANIVMFVYFAAFFPMIVVTEQYIYSKLSDEYGFHTGNNSNCDLNKEGKRLQKKVQSESSLWMIALKVQFFIDLLVI